jgi:hypothetical protein
MLVESQERFNAVARKPGLGAGTDQHARPHHTIRVLFSMGEFGRQY